MELGIYKAEYDEFLIVYLEDGVLKNIIIDGCGLRDGALHGSELDNFLKSNYTFVTGEDMLFKLLTALFEHKSKK